MGLVVAMQTGGWLENQVIFKEKNLIAFWSIALTRSHIIWTSWCHMKAMMCGYMARVKNMDFLLGISCLGDNFQLKITQKYMHFMFKALELLLMTQMRQGTINKESKFFIILSFCFTSPCRIPVINRSSSALNMKCMYF